MPGPQVKDWRQYHSLRDQGYSKEAAARITNATVAGIRRKRKRSKRERLKAAHKRLQ